MSDATRLVRPATPAGHDPSRAAQRAADPRGWRYGDDDLEAVHRVIAERRDIRRFRPDPVPDDVLDRILAAAHRAPSVGLMQPWRLIVIRGMAPRIAIRDVAARERLRQAGRFDERARAFLDQKVEGIVEAPLGVCVCCDHGEPGEEILGRGTIPDTDVYSTACAIQNLWLAARAEGLGVGWVSFYRLADLRAILGIPERVDPIAYLCIGWPDERPVRPGPGVQRLGVAGGRRPGGDGGALGGADGGTPPPAARRRARGRRPPDRRSHPRPRRRDPRPRPLRPSSSSPAAASARSSRSSSAGRPPAARRRRRGCTPASSSAPPTTATPRTARACSAARSPPRSPPPPRAARPRPACSPATAVMRCSSPTSACAGRRRPASPTARSRPAAPT